MSTTTLSIEKLVRVGTLAASALSVGLLVGCLPQLPPEANASPSPSAGVSPQGGVGASCASPIPVRGRGTATLTELPHEIGTSVVFGLDGSFVATAYGYPLGAHWHWFEEDVDGKIVSRFEWRWQGGLLQSPDGGSVVYEVATDTTSGRTVLFIRDMLGPGRLLAPITRAGDLRRPSRGSACRDRQALGLCPPVVPGWAPLSS